MNTGSIVAAAVGGAVLLAGLPFGVKMYMRKRKWRRTQRPRKLQEREMRRQWAEQAEPYMTEEIALPSPTTEGGNFLFSQDWHGKPRAGAATSVGTQGSG